ncbi:DUF4157 domain-containing protein [Methanosarcina sp. UBA5]|uniref:eCIS core domain-containing protein n=1 Tax=Methanosarcina sp. UBA5 TaxID=1915593 RepID=UPI0025F231EE|nr:DUF4157 domain-containing protein [Methanosarcina sp. UBA5]
MAIIQRARMNPKSLTPGDVMQLQSTIGNRAVVRLLSEIGAIPSKAKQAPPVQSQELVQRQGIPEEEEPLQGKFENKPEICPSCFAAPIMQRQEIPEEEEPLQGKFETVQRQEIPEEEEPLQTKKNNTGMPDNLKAGVENLSGIDMSDVRVHYNSSKPAEVGALAYTQGTNIHVAQGQERHLPHEAWHVVQQSQERVRPTMQLKDIAINDDVGLEQEADEMGAKAFTMGQDVFFRQGTYEPGSREGQELIAHELTHVVKQSGGCRSLMARKNRQISHTELILQAAFEEKGIDYRAKAEKIEVMKVDPGNNSTGEKDIIKKGDAYELVDHLPGTPEKNLIKESIKNGRRVQIFKEDCKDEKWDLILIPKIEKMAFSLTALSKRGVEGGLPKAATESAKVETKGGLKRPPFELQDVPKSGIIHSFTGESKQSTGQVRVEELKEMERRGALVTYKETPIVLGKVESKRITTFCAYCLKWIPSENLDSDHIITSTLLGKQLLRLNEELAKYPKLIEVFKKDFEQSGIDIKLFFLENTAKKWEVSQRGWELIFQNLKNLVFACKECNQVVRGDEDTVTFLRKMLFFGDAFFDYMSTKIPSWKDDVERGRMPGLTDYILDYIQTQDHTKIALEEFKKQFLLDTDVQSRIRTSAALMLPGKSKADKELGEGGMRKVETALDLATTVMEEAKTPGRNGVEWSRGDKEEFLESMAFQVSRLGSGEPSYPQLYEEREFLSMQLEETQKEVQRQKKEMEEKGKLLDQALAENERLRAELAKFMQSAPVPPK